MCVCVCVSCFWMEYAKDTAITITDVVLYTFCEANAQLSIKRYKSQREISLEKHTCLWATWMTFAWSVIIAIFTLARPDGNFIMLSTRLNVVVVVSAGGVGAAAVVSLEKSACELDVCVCDAWLWNMTASCLIFFRIINQHKKMVENGKFQQTNQNNIKNRVKRTQ